MKKYKCLICGYIYDESVHGTKWEDLSDDFICPVCGASKSVFKQEEDTPPVQVSASYSQNVQDSKNIDIHAFQDHKIEDLLELSAGEISAICSSLAKGCEKQRLNQEMEAFNKIADYFKAKEAAAIGSGEKGKMHHAELADMLDDDLTKKFVAANDTAKANADRGALRSLVWSEKVSMAGKVLLDRFAKEGDDMLANTKIFVCDICGFIYLGEAPPDICPVCKVPSHKIIQVERS
jgi:rubredoxin